MDIVTLASAKKHTNNKFADLSNIKIIKDFPDYFVINKTINDLIKSMNVNNIPSGMIYLGEVQCSDLPTGVNNAELKIDTVTSTLGSVGYYFELTSRDVNPYLWTATYFDDTFSGWQKRPVGENFTSADKESLENKLNKIGFEPNKFLGTDESGNIIVKSGASTLETDATLSLSGVPADAKAVGDKLADSIKEAELVYNEADNVLELNENKTLDNIVSVDPTLSNEGEAGDAKVIGDKFNKLTEDTVDIRETLDDLSNLKNGTIKNNVQMEIGRITSTGINTTETKYCYSSMIFENNGQNIEFDTEEYRASIVSYDDIETYKTLTSWQTTSPVSLSISNYPKVRVMLKSINSTNINKDDVANSTYIEGESNQSLLVKIVNGLTESIKTLNVKSVYVSASNGSDSNDGNETSPFKTIQKAIDSGIDTIYIEPAEYKEFLKIENRDKITIMPTGFNDYTTDIPDAPMIKINGEDTRYGGLWITNVKEVNICNIWVDHATRDCLRLKNVQNANVVHCITSNNSVADFMGFDIDNINGVFRDCLAYNITRDGFNIHGYGYTGFIDCVAHDCGDDGLSHHDGCTGYVKGGEYYNNGKGGVASPTYGAYIDVDSVYLHNNKYGIYSVSDTTHRLSKGRISNCAFKNNTNSDYFVDYSDLTEWNTISDKTTGIRTNGSLTVII